MLKNKNVHVRLRGRVVLVWAARHDHKLGDIARRAQIHPSHLSQLMHGHRNPNPDTRARLRAVLVGVPWRELFEEVA